MNINQKKPYDDRAAADGPAKSVINALVIFLVLTLVVAVAVSAIVPAGVISDATSQRWQVVGSYENSAGAAILLAKTHQRTIAFLRYLEHKYHISETDDVIAQESEVHQRVVATEAHKLVAALLAGYDIEVAKENDPAVSQETSYTVNKGSAMFICLRDKANPLQLADADTLFFTHLHELAHIANYASWGHDSQFWAVFKFLLREARTAGVYYPVDYAKHPVVFCGLAIDWNPLYDASVRDI